MVQELSGSRYHPAAAKAPPSRLIVAPVTQDDKSDAKNKADPAASDGFPKRPYGSVSYTHLTLPTNREV